METIKGSAVARVGTESVAQRTFKAVKLLCAARRGWTRVTTHLPKPPECAEHQGSSGGGAGPGDDRRPAEADHS